MKPASFRYFRPDTLDEALDLLRTYGDDAKPLAGGQSLVPAMNFRLAQPAVLVDLNRIPNLGAIDSGGDGLRVGGMVRHRTLERDTHVAAHAPLVTAAMPLVAHPPIRTRGTLGGSLAHADPAAELPAVMLALDAAFVLRSQTRTRTVGASDFFMGLYTTAMEPDELLIEVVVPPHAPRTGSAVQEVVRRHGDFALAGAAAVVALDARGVVTSARLALFGVDERPVLAAGAADALVGMAPTPEAIDEAANLAGGRDVSPMTDIHASSRYRRHLATVLARRVLTHAAAAAGAV